MAPRRAGRARQLVGRGPLMEAVAGPLDELTQGRGAMLLLSGEPGIGKTRLAEEIVARARALGATVAWGSSWRGDAAPPLWPWIQVLRELTGNTAVLDQPGPETPTASAAARFKQLDSVLNVLRAHASAHPLVIAIDDLQWADAGSIAMLTFVASALRYSPCMIIATYRPDEMRRDDVAELSRAGTTLALPPLDDDASAELLRAAVGGAVSADAEAAIVRRGAGNPLFVWEFGQLMAQSGRTDVAPAAIPPAVAAVIERRLARLAESDVAVLRAAAIAGSPFASATIRDLLNGDHDALGTALDAATAVGLIERVDDTSFAFSHGGVHAALIEAFRAGTGVPYADYAIHDAQGDFNRPAFLNLLTTDWLPQVPGAIDRLTASPARVAEIGCGEGWAAIAIAKAWPHVEVNGFDNDEASVAAARKHAADHGVGDRVHFEVVDVTRELPLRVDAGSYDIVLAFEMVHDLARPRDALRTMRNLGRPDAVVLVVDEKVGERFEAATENPVERLMYAASVLHCLPVGMVDPESAGTGTVMRPTTFKAYAADAGFSSLDVLPIEHDLFRFYHLI